VTKTKQPDEDTARGADPLGGHVTLERKRAARPSSQAAGRRFDPVTARSTKDSALERADVRQYFG
jgi:hypothetical protein